MINILRVLKKFLGLDFYISPLDQFLEDYDKNHPKISLSQRKEIEKYARIIHLRNHKVASETPSSLWHQF